MSFYVFRLLSTEVQLRYVLARGTYLASRRDRTTGVNLYHLDDGGRGYFVEVALANGDLQPVVGCSFVSVGALRRYTDEMELPEGWA